MSGMPKVHPRTLPVAKASAEIRTAVGDLADKHGLTYVELLQALGDVTATCLKYMLRAERHPDDPDRPAEWE